MSALTRTTFAILSTLLVGVLLPGAAAAQEEVRFGVKGGLTMASLSGEQRLEDLSIALDFESELGFAAGAFANLPLRDGLSLQPELMLQQRRTDLELPVEIDELGGEPEFGFRTTYLEVPVLLRYTSTDGSLRPVFFAGPSLALNLDSEFHTDVGGADVDVDVGDETSDLDFGLALGAGLQLDPNLSVEARYTIGLSDFDDTEGVDELRWRTWLFAVGYAF